MKRLGVYAFIVTLFICVFFTGENSVYAQQTSTGSADGNRAKGVALFEAQLSTLRNSNLAGNKGQPTVDALIKVISYSESIFVDAFNAEIKSGTSAEESFRLALSGSSQALRSPFFNENVKYGNKSLVLNDAERKLLDPQAGNLLVGDYSTKRILDSFIAVLGAAQPGEFKDSSPGSSNTAIVNAQKKAADTVAQEEKTEDCSFFDGNLVGCVDQFVTWIIKHTLLQVAGFLVWLTANMMNFAIQISILNFSQWAPPSLYPIWIIIRQIVSLAVVFAGLWLGFMYIIGREQTFGKYVGWLVIFALFVNFSYPVTRALTDISNIVSLNVYSAAVGTSPLEKDFKKSVTTLGDNTAGSLIMNRLGLIGLVGSATDVKTKQSDLIGSINSTPGALITLAFVLYAAYIFFMATAIIATRTAVLVFLIVASPLLLVDSVIPKLGEAAKKLRGMFFEQLIVAPVFMIMLALTLKFMEVFQSGVNGKSGPLGTISTGSLTGGADSIQVFFSVLMMLIMLHIMLKVTKSVAGEAGSYATNFMGKVGGFGLGVASAGTGLLARGTIGQLALGARNSQWMDGMKDSKVGRGLYGLSNSLAQSTFDTRNIGMVSKGMASAGLTGGLGMSMQQGGKKGFEAEQKGREEKVLGFGANIRDDKTRASYFQKANNGFVYSKVDDAKLRIAERESQQKKDAQLTTLMSTADKEKRKLLIDQALASKDFAMAEKLKAGDAYMKVDNSSLEGATQKAELLKKMGLTEEKAENLVNKQDPFADLQKEHDLKLKELDLNLGKMNRNSDAEKKAYDNARTEIGKFKADHEKQVADLRTATIAAYKGTSSSAASQGSSTSATEASAPSQAEMDQLNKVLSTSFAESMRKGVTTTA